MKSLFFIMCDNMNYWETNEREQQPTYTAPTKKRLRFGESDILEHMNMKVDKNGVLKFMSSSAPISYAQNDDHSNDQMGNHGLPTYEDEHKHTQTASLHLPYENSYIYNKYFQDYTAHKKAERAQLDVPKTPEEYYARQMEAQKERERVRQIKSTKLLFTTHSTAGANIPPPVIRPSAPIRGFSQFYFSRR